MLTTVEVATLLGVSGWLVRKLAREGDLPALRIGGVLRFRESALSDWLEGRSIGRLELSQMADDDVVRGALAYLSDRKANRANPICTRCGEYPMDPELGVCQTCATQQRREAEKAEELERQRKREWWAANGQAWRQKRKQAAKQSEEVDERAQS